MNFDEMSVTDLLSYYNKKNLLIQDGNLLELIELKKFCPDLLVKEKEIEVNQLVDTTKYLTDTPHFKALLREEKKRRLIPIDYEQWQIGALIETLNRYEKISYINIHDVSRELVKEAIVTCRTICNEQENHSSLSKIFPLLGLLINEILILFPPEKREHKLKLAIFKMRGKELERSDLKETETETEVSQYSLLREQVRNSFTSMLKKIILKFDQRKEFYNDLCFFCLIEVADFIGLLIPSMGSREDETALIISRIEKNILIQEVD